MISVGAAASLWENSGAFSLRLSRYGFSCPQALPPLGEGSDTAVGPILGNAPEAQFLSCAGAGSQ